MADLTARQRPDHGRGSARSLRDNQRGGRHRRVGSRSAKVRPSCRRKDLMTQEAAQHRRRRCWRSSLAAGDRRDRHRRDRLHRHRGDLPGACSRAGLIFGKFPRLKVPQRADLNTRRRAADGRAHRAVARKPAPRPAPAGGHAGRQDRRPARRARAAARSGRPGASRRRRKRASWWASTCPRWSMPIAASPRNLRSEKRAGSHARRAAGRQPRQDQRRDRPRHPAAGARARSTISRSAPAISTTSTATPTNPPRRTD